MILQVQPISLPALFLAPASERNDDGAGSSSGREPGASPPLRVLVVEDEGLVAMNVEMALADAGFEVLETVDTELDAVAAAQRLHPDVVVMDITLRQGDGIAAARAIMAKTNARVVFISGNSDPATLATAEKISHRPFIRKPFATERLAKLVKDALAVKK